MTFFCGDDNKSYSSRHHILEKIQFFLEKQSASPDAT